MLAVSYFSAEDKQLFLGYATHKMPWEERANGRILFKGDVETCEYSKINNETILMLAGTRPDTLVHSLSVGCRMAPVDLTKSMVATLDGDCTQHFDVIPYKKVLLKSASSKKLRIPFPTHL